VADTSDNGIMNFCSLLPEEIGLDCNIIFYSDTEFIFVVCI
jgi:hypothetical protein